MTVDATGTVLDGDFVLALAARHFAKHGKLDPKLVVGTVMTNGGLEATLARDGIGLVRPRSATATSGRSSTSERPSSAASRRAT